MSISGMGMSSQATLRAVVRMVLVTALKWDEARDSVRRVVTGCGHPQTETIPLEDALGRVLANRVVADRSYPPFPRATRDGFAVRAKNLPGRLRIVGEVRAGEVSTRAVEDGECIEIMTGAPTPAGADAILMIEYVERDGDLIDTTSFLSPGENICEAGSEAPKGESVLEPGTRIDYAHIGALATVGAAQVGVFVRPKVSIIATGDELVPVQEQPENHQIRNSNSWSLAALVKRSGGEVASLSLARDNKADLRSAMDRAFEADLVLLSGGVSAGKYDLVEEVLAEDKAEFYFTRVKVQPGQPSVFGKARGKCFFGLPGNPVSTMVTFELFARLAIELLSGERTPRLPLTRARLTTQFRHVPGKLTRFLPAHLSDLGDTVTPVKWQGSGDVFAVGRANAFMVADIDREAWGVGDQIRVLPR